MANKDITGLDVPVGDPCLVEGLHSAEAVVHKLADFAEVEVSPLALPVNDRHQVGFSFPVCIEGRKSVWYWYC